MRSRWVTRSLPPSRERWRSSRPAMPMPSATSVRVRRGCSTSFCLAQAATSFSDNISRLLRHGEPDMAALDRLGEQFDTLFVGPPLGHGA